MDAQSQSLKQPIVFDTTSGRVGDKIPQSMHILEEQGNIALQNTAALVRVWRIRTNCPKTALQCKSCPAGLNWVKCCSVLFMRSLMVGRWHTVAHCGTLWHTVTHCVNPWIFELNSSATETWQYPGVGRWVVHVSVCGRFLDGVTKKRKTISTTVEASQTLGEVGILGQVHR